MCARDITREDVSGRARVADIAPKDSSAALKLARNIKHPWYRCQALASIAPYLARKTREQVLEEALMAAREQAEINPIVTVSAWPIRELAISHPELAAERIRGLVILANTEPHNLRRSHALRQLAFFVSDHPTLLSLIVPALTEALLGGGGPRIDRVIRDTFELIRTVQPKSLHALAMHHKTGRKQEQLLATL
jgi:hypothetical protein